MNLPVVDRSQYFLILRDAKFHEWTVIDTESFSPERQIPYRRLLPVVGVSS